MLNKSKKTLIIFLIAIFFVFNFNIKKVNAGGLWFESIAAEIMHETWAELSEQIKGIFIAKLKQEGLKAFANTVRGEADDQLITNFNSYLSGEVKNETEDYVTNLYATVADRDSGGDYTDMARGITQKAIQNDLSSEVGGSEIENILNPGANVKEDLFKASSGGGVEVIPRILGDRENLYGRFMGEATNISNTREVIKEAKITEATGHGYRGNGEVSGEVLASKVAKAETLQQDLIANATTAGEIAAIMGTEFDPSEILAASLRSGKEALRSLAKGALGPLYKGVAGVTGLQAVDAIAGGNYSGMGSVSFQ